MSRHPATPAIEPQPDTTTCGPTCLHAVYRHFGADDSLVEVIQRIQRLDHGGTLDVFLANDALERGYRGVLYTYNLEVFDPTWFGAGTDLAAKLNAQLRARPGRRLATATRGYLRYLELGGEIHLRDLPRNLLRRLLNSSELIVALCPRPSRAGSWSLTIPPSMPAARMPC